MKTLRALSFALASILAAFCLCAAAPASAQQPYRVLAHWKIGGGGRWDYMHADAQAHRLYIAHGDTVDVIDTRTGQSIGAIAGLHGTHGIALDNHGNYGYISDGGGDAVVVFDRHTLEKVATIPAGSDPDGIVFEPATQTVWAFNGHSRNVTVIDAAKRAVAAIIPLPGKPEFPVVDGTGAVFDNIESKNEIVRFDAHTDRITAEWPIGCNSPSGLAIDVHGHRLFSVCDDKQMAVVDYETGKVLAHPGIGEGPDAARYSARFNLAFASCRQGVLTVIDAGAPDYPAIETLPTEPGARTMAYDAATDRIYLVTAGFGPAPAPTADHPHPRPAAIPGTFNVIVVGR